MRNLALIILDGWGLGEERENNAIHIANTPFFDHLWNTYPHTSLQASGEYVGLPEGQIGGSEVGHMTIGAGRVVYQELVRINRSLMIPDSEEYVLNNQQFKDFLEKAKTKQAHFVGLISDGGVHSHINHLKYLLSFMKEAGCKEPVIHFISDGRDTSPTSGVGYAHELLNRIAEIQYGKVVTLSGRFYAMDRDKNMDRTARAVEVILHAHSTSPRQADLTGDWKDTLLKGFESNYAEATSDEFLEPMVVDSLYSGATSEDIFFFFNFRSDRMKQLITEINKEIPTNSIFTLTQYDKSYSFPIIFAKIEKTGTFGELLSKRQMKQARVAETEKFPHVTYFFNGGVEVVYEGEIRRGVASNKVTHDQMPEMKATEIARSVEELVREESPHFILVNFANPDMVGHTGVFEAVVKGVERVDSELKHLCTVLGKAGYICCITADHGNADIMYDLETKELHTAHTLNPVPFIVYDPQEPKNQNLVLDQHPANGLHMIAGTMLELMEVHDHGQEYESLIVH